MRRSQDIPNTCPTIDKVKRFVNEAVSELRIAIGSCEHESELQTMESVKDWLDGIDDLLEEIRVANSKLRERGDWYLEKVEELEAERT